MYYHVHGAANKHTALDYLHVSLNSKNIPRMHKIAYINRQITMFFFWMWGHIPSLDPSSTRKEETPRPQPSLCAFGTSIFTAWRYASAIAYNAVVVCLSVRVSKRIFTKIMPHDSPGTLVWFATAITWSMVILLSSHCGLQCYSTVVQTAVINCA